MWFPRDALTYLHNLSAFFFIKELTSSAKVIAKHQLHLLSFCLPFCANAGS